MADARGRQPAPADRPTTRRPGPAGSDGRRSALGRGSSSASDSPRLASPQLFEEAQASLLDRRVRDALSILGSELSERVGRHLCAAGLLLDDDPQEALAHARYARQRAPRLAEVREALGVAAYAAGDFTLARAELRTARRMTGSLAVLPLLADCERALGRPDEALALAQTEGVGRLDRADQLELLLVAAGARLDLGQAPQALRVLSVPELRASDDVAAESGTVLRLWYVYAEALLADRQTGAAIDWFARVASLGGDLTDADERLDALGAHDGPGPEQHQP